MKARYAAMSAAEHGAASSRQRAVEVEEARPIAAPVQRLQTAAAQCLCRHRTFHRMKTTFETTPFGGNSARAETAWRWFPNRRRDFPVPREQSISHRCDTKRRDESGAGKFGVVKKNHGPRESLRRRVMADVNLRTTVRDDGSITVRVFEIRFST